MLLLLVLLLLAVVLVLLFDGQVPKRPWGRTRPGEVVGEGAQARPRAFFWFSGGTFVREGCEGVGRIYRRSFDGGSATA